MGPSPHPSFAGRSGLYLVWPFLLVAVFAVSRTEGARQEELCVRLVLGVLEKVYREGVGAAQKYLEGFCAENTLLGGESACASFARRLVKALQERDADHAVVEAILRGDRAWTERCIAAVRGAQEALFLQEEDRLRLRALEHALTFVLEASEKGLKPKLEG